MHDRDELQGLWQSQPVEDRSIPRFALIEDMTAPVQYPMSRAMRWSNAVALLWLAYRAWQELGRESSELEIVAARVMFAASLIGGMLMLFPLGQAAQSPPPEASIAEFRRHMAREFMRQTAVERRLLVPVFGLVWGAMIVRSTAEVARGGFAWYHLLVPLLFTSFFGFIVWYTRQARQRSLRRILSGL